MLPRQDNNGINSFAFQDSICHKTHLLRFTCYTTVVIISWLCIFHPCFIPMSMTQTSLEIMLYTISFTSDDTKFLCTVQSHSTWLPPLSYSLSSFQSQLNECWRNLPRGNDFHGEIVPKKFGDDFSWGRFLQGTISPDTN